MKKQYQEVENNRDELFVQLQEITSQLKNANFAVDQLRQQLATLQEQLRLQDQIKAEQEAKR